MVKGVVVVLVFTLLLVGLLAVTVAAAVVGLWQIALVDLVVLLIVAVGLRAAFPARRAVLTYREILERQESHTLAGMAAELKPVPVAVEPVIAAEPVVEQPVMPSDQPPVMRPLTVAAA